MNKKTVLISLSAMLLTGVAAQAQAQSWPTRPVKIIAPFSSGGTVDVLSRDLASRMSAGLGQQVIVENRAGANGLIGAEAVARAAPDGYTLGMLGTPHAAAPFVQKLSFDMQADFAPVSLVANVPSLLSVSMTLPVKSLKEMVALARQQPGRLTYAHAGNLTAGHLAMELLRMQARADIIPVPYKGGGPALLGLVSGQTDALIIGPTAQLPHAKAGKLRPIAIASPRRLAILPDVPTIAESGVPGLEQTVTEWYGLFVPAKTPPEVINRLHAEVARVMALPDMKERMASIGAEPVGSRPEELKRFFHEETEKVGALIRALGLKAE
jgi:tripartite-type tricarboxylate transporter receptor subunit TctC